MREVNPVSGSSSNQPRGAVIVNGVPVQWVSWEIDSNSTFNADTFRAVVLPTVKFPVSKWTDGTSYVVEIKAGFPRNPDSFDLGELTTLIVGRVDDVEYNLLHGAIELSGRDFTGILIDQKTTEKFANLTSSQIAEQLAVRAGLYPVVTATSTKAGTYYDIDHARITESMSVWDLLGWLAHEEGFLVYVKGYELHFEPKPSADGGVYALRWDKGDGGPVKFNGKSLNLSRNLTVAKDVVVTVKSWNAKKKVAILAVYPRVKHKSAAPGTSGVQEPSGYERNVPGLTYEQALQLAQKIHGEITAHEMKLHASLPADNVLDITMMVELQGTGTAFDQLYFPHSISRQMSASEGYSMTLAAKNRAPDNQATL